MDEWNPVNEPPHHDLGHILWLRAVLARPPDDQAACHPGTAP